MVLKHSLRGMFIHRRKIYLRETDATGNLFFSEQLNFALEAFQMFLASKGFLLLDMLTKHQFVMPIVHAQTDFKNALKVGDSIELHLFLKEIGTTSFTLFTKIINEQKKMEAGTAEIIHVTVSKKTKKPIPLPDLILGQLQHLGTLQGVV